MKNLGYNHSLVDYIQGIVTPHGQCNAKPTATFPGVERHHPLTGTNLYCMLTEANVFEQLV